MNADKHLTDSDRLLEGLRLGRVGVWRWELSSDRLLWSDNLEAVHAMPPGAFDGTLASFRADLHPEDAARVWQAITASIETGAPYKVVYRSTAVVGGAPLWIEATGGVVRDVDGRAWLTGVCLDVSARVRSEAELARRLRQQQAVQALSAFALGAARLDDVFEQAVATAAHIFDVPLAKILQFTDSADRLQVVAGVGWREGVVGRATVGTDAASQAGFTLASVEPVVVRDLMTEPRFSGPSLLIEHGVRSGMSVVVAGPDSRPFGVFGVHSTELREFDRNDVEALMSLANIVAASVRQHRAAEQQALLLREMAHRSGNLLQVVASIASQTFRMQSDKEVALEDFAARLGALSRSTHLIMQGGWSTTRLRSLAGAVLAPYGERITCAGRDIVLPSDLSFDVGMILHELATNSAKYGSLSQATGDVTVDWRIEEDAGGQPILVLEWSDSARGTRKASGTGFGAKLKRRIIEQKWKGSYSISLDGAYRFDCRLPIPPAGGG